MDKLEVTCPHCGQSFETEVLDSTYYESLVARWVDGKLVPPRTAGYDVITRIDGEEITIQVKSSRQKDWTFIHRMTSISPNVFVLFGVMGHDYCVFMLDFKTFADKSSLHSIVSGKERRGLYTWRGKGSFIWDYLIHEPEKNLLPRIKAMIADRQLELLQ